jgi:DNA processing protein
VDRAYPRGNERLIEQMAGRGAVVSEVPPGAAPTRGRFLQRNRLIAALSGATVVVEAAWRSGALNTATHAARLGRPVAAVPGPITSPASAGCHELLRDGAVCVTDADEVVELVSPLGDAPPSPGRPVPVADHDGLGPADLRVYDALSPRRPMSELALVRTAGLAEAEVSAALGRLHLRGLAARDGIGWRRMRLQRE